MPNDGPPAKLHSTTCFETKPLLATLVALALLTFLWNIHPYRHSTLLSSTNSSTAAYDISFADKKLSAVAAAATADPNKRVFTPYGNAAALFIQMGAYRGRPDTFAVIGLASKPIHVFGKPWYKCKWLSNNGTVANGKAYKMFPTGATTASTLSWSSTAPSPTATPTATTQAGSSFSKPTTTSTPRNDCLHRYQYAANWTFCFDIDVYIFLPDGWTLELMLSKLAPFTQFTIEQN